MDIQITFKNADEESLITIVTALSVLARYRPEVHAQTEPSESEAAEKAEELVEETGPEAAESFEPSYPDEPVVLHTPRPRRRMKPYGEQLIPLSEAAQAVGWDYARAYWHVMAGNLSTIVRNSKGRKYHYVTISQMRDFAEGRHVRRPRPSDEVRKHAAERIAA